ncbi:hypothetical protein [Microbacterium sp. zg.Y909]|uniref:hypothetical protein n=1 Tax=Microbacterium sp. zg.Y909 TaxID=2969413 RepID=UPI00214C63FD|nr:hypothetical protein [Microbacterium sp. zg.Y909]MCR2827207.1 hypothetical protein [Microbacterium sp. zg.Y909]
MGSARYEFEGVLGMDSPDPMDAQWERIAQWPIPVFGLAPQPTIEMFGPSEIGSGSDSAGLRDAQVGLSYIVIRNPADRADPTNLADLDEEALRALDEVPPWPRPKWLIELTDRQRYPMLWEAGRTSWYRDPAERPSIAEALVDHTAEVLNTSFRPERGLDGRVGSLPPAPDITTAAVQHDAILRIDGIDRPAVLIDTDPHVFAVGTELDGSALVTVVLTRDELPFIQVELITHAST